MDLFIFHMYIIYGLWVVHHQTSPGEMHKTELFLAF